MLVYPKLSAYDYGIFRLFGPGLGNLLFPWARALVVAKNNNVNVIFPTWHQLKVGPLLRNERDKRLYFDLFKPTSRYVHGRKKIQTLVLNRKITEKEYIKKDFTNTARKVAIFEGMNDGFSVSTYVDEKVVQEHDYIFEELLAITKEKHKTGLNFDFGRSISVHARLTDFAQPENEEEIKQGKHNVRIPFDWYISQIKKIRNVLGQEIPVHVFSDSSNEALSEILALENSNRLFFGSSIADLLAMSESNILISSGSTFSSWASYLGRMPIIWYPGQLRYRLYRENPDLEIELSKNEDLPGYFVEKLKTSQNKNNTV